MPRFLTEMATNIDWPLLAKQKQALLALDENELVTGIIHLIDALQDAAANEGLPVVWLTDADATDVDVYLGRMGESAGGEMGVIDGGSLHPIVREFWSVWATRPMDGGGLDMLFEKDFDLDQEAEARAEAAALAERYGVDYTTL